MLGDLQRAGVGARRRVGRLGEAEGVEVVSGRRPFPVVCVLVCCCRLQLGWVVLHVHCAWTCPDRNAAAPTRASRNPWCKHVHGIARMSIQMPFLDFAGRYHIARIVPSCGCAWAAIGMPARAKRPERPAVASWTPGPWLGAFACSQLRFAVPAAQAIVPRRAHWEEARCRLERSRNSALQSALGYRAKLRPVGLAPAWSCCCWRRCYYYY